MLLIENKNCRLDNDIFWGISYEQEFTKIIEYHICQQGNILLDNLLSEGQDHTSKVSDAEVFAFSECF